MRRLTIRDTFSPARPLAHRRRLFCAGCLDRVNCGVYRRTSSSCDGAPAYENLYRGTLYRAKAGESFSWRVGAQPCRGRYFVASGMTAERSTPSDRVYAEAGPWQERMNDQWRKAPMLRISESGEDSAAWRALETLFWFVTRPFRGALDNPWLWVYTGPFILMSAILDFSWPRVAIYSLSGRPPPPAPPPPHPLLPQLRDL